MARTPSPIRVRKSRVWSTTFDSLRKSVIKESSPLKAQSPLKGQDAEEEDGMMGVSMRAREPIKVDSQDRCRRDWCIGPNAWELDLMSGT